MQLGEAGEIRTHLKKVPDLERLLSKIHTAGDMKRNQSHPDSRAVMFDGNVYSKRKIMDLLICLDGFKKSMEIMSLLQVIPAPPLSLIDFFLQFCVSVFFDFFWAPVPPHFFKGQHS